MGNRNSPYQIRINVIGASGSGTSTLGKSLAATLAIPHFESDDYFHIPTDPPFQCPRPAEERCELISRDLKPEANWVLSGGIVGWIPYPPLSFTCFVFLYVETAVRVERLRRRERIRFGHRIEHGGDMYDSHEEFINWASRYDTGNIEGKTLARHKAYLLSQSRPVLEYHGERAVSEITESVLQFIRGTGNSADLHVQPEQPTTRVQQT